MKKKMVGILVCMLLIATALPALGLVKESANQKTNTIILDEVDQQSTKSDKVYAIGPSDKELAQSFTPTLPVLTKVILRLKSTGTPEFYYYYVDIKSSYLGSALTTAYIHRDTLVIGTNTCEFDFPDIIVTPGTKYYIILRGVSDSSDLSKVWWWYGYPDPYAGGDAWYESISGWNYLQEGIVRCDFWFQTYGMEEEENNPPYAPVQPSGPTSGVVDESYFYTTSAIDPDGDQIQYGWDWDGDGIVDEYSNLMNSGNVDSRSHAWTSTGTYNVKVKAKDEHNALSGFSSPLAVTITSGVNQPPNKPSTPSGPTSGKTGTQYGYSSNTIDSDGDDVFYMFDWDDGTNSGWLGPYISGDTVNAFKTWTAQGSYNVKVKAMDSNLAESEWSDPLATSMPKNKAITLGNQGIFEAELGRRGSDEPFVTLEGEYQIRDRFVAFGGTATADDKEGRFRGGFRGNHFIIKIPIIGRTLTLFGRFNQNDDNTFQGVWIGRGTPARGWITGTLIPRHQ